MERQIQEYLIERVIREDILGTVYHALHIPSAQSVILRQIPASLQQAFHAQALGYNLLVSLAHPGIGTFYTYIKEADELYLISEYISGSTLDQYLACRSQGLSEEKTWDIAIELIDAFVYAFRKGINHFTLHPENILFTADEKVKIADFGLTNLFLPHVQHVDRELNLAAYRSPEQIQGKALDVRSDIYTFGVILFQLLTRQPPYPDLLPLSVIEDKILHHSLPPIKLYTTAFAHSYTMQAIIDKATAKNPAYRFENFLELKESLLEEKQEREALLLDQLMQEVNQRSQLHASDMVSTITLAKQKRLRKRVGQTVLVVALMAGAIGIGIKITPSPTGEKLNVIEAENKIPSRIESKQSQEDSQVLKRDTHTPIKATDLAVEKQTISPPKQEAVPHQKAPLQAAKTKHKSTERAVSHAGFSFDPQPENHFREVQLKNRLEGFYAALGSKQLSQMKGYYASTLTRFFNEKNINEKQLQSLLQKAWKRTPQDKHEIFWDTFTYEQDEQGDYTMEFYMNYTYHRANKKNWRSRKIYTQIKMDKDLKIYYMVGD